MAAPDEKMESAPAAAAPEAPEKISSVLSKYTIAADTRKKSIGDLSYEKYGSGQSKLVDSYLQSYKEKASAKATGFKEKFDPLNLVNKFTGGSKTLTAAAGRAMGRSEADTNYFVDKRGKTNSVSDKPDKITPEKRGAEAAAVAAGMKAAPSGADLVAQTDDKNFRKEQRDALLKQNKFYDLVQQKKTILFPQETFLGRLDNLYDIIDERFPSLGGGGAKEEAKQDARPTETPSNDNGGGGGGLLNSLLKGGGSLLRGGANLAAKGLNAGKNALGWAKGKLGSLFGSTETAVQAGGKAATGAVAEAGGEAAAKAAGTEIAEAGIKAAGTGAAEAGGEAAAKAAGGATAEAIAESAGKVTAKAATGAAVKAGAEGASKAAITAAVEESAVKSIPKLLGDSIPLISALPGLAFSVMRLMEGDYVGAGIEAASGVGGALAGPLGAIPFMVTAIARDVYKAIYGIQPEEDPQAGERLGQIKDIAFSVVSDQVTKLMADIPESNTSKKAKSFADVGEKYGGTVGKYAAGAVGGVVGMGADIEEGAGNLLKSAADATGVTGAVNSVTGAVGSATDAVTGAAGSATEAVTGAVSGAWDWATGSDSTETPSNKSNETASPVATPKMDEKNPDLSNMSDAEFETYAKKLASDPSKNMSAWKLVSQDPRMKKLQQAAQARRAAESDVGLQKDENTSATTPAAATMAPVPIEPVVIPTVAEAPIAVPAPVQTAQPVAAPQDLGAEIKAMSDEDFEQYATVIAKAGASPAEAKALQSDPRFAKFREKRRAASDASDAALSASGKGQAVRNYDEDSVAAPVQTVAPVPVAQNNMNNLDQTREAAAASTPSPAPIIINGGGGGGGSQSAPPPPAPVQTGVGSASRNGSINRFEDKLTGSHADYIP